VADTFHWPDDSEFEALDLDPASPKGSTKPADTRRGSDEGQVAMTAHVMSDADDEFPVESKALVVPIRPTPQKVQIQPVEEDDAWYPSEDDHDGGVVSGVQGVAPAPGAMVTDPEEPRDKKTQNAEAWQELRSRVSVIDTNRKIAGVARWALPALGLVVVIESGWMLAGMVGGPKPAATATAPLATPVADPSTTAANANAASTPAAPAPSSPEPKAAATAPAAIGKTPAVVPASQASQSPAVPSIAPSIAPSLAAASRPAPEAAPAVATAPAPAAPGAVLISLPFQVQVFEQGRFVGIIDGGPLRLSPGAHTLRLVNESVGFNVTQSVTIAPTKTTRVDVPTPTARVQLNAVPWAEVIIDGKSVGETPLGNVAVSIGPHTFVFRNPKYREQTRTIVVSGQGANRVSVDLTQ
jgi:hypothetical protein